MSYVNRPITSCSCVFYPAARNNTYIPYTSEVESPSGSTRRGGSAIPAEEYIIAIAESISREHHLWQQPATRRVRAPS
eukprot:scaffold5142_cov102-Skeletonema_marinoi.AAC.1